jgi:putative membrane protein
MTVAVQLATDAIADRWGHGDGMMDGWGGGWMWLWWLLLIAGLITMIVVAMLAMTRGLSSRNARDGGRSTARDVLDERYARGELTTEEYHERLTELKRP